MTARFIRYQGEAVAGEPVDMPCDDCGLFDDCECSVFASSADFERRRMARLFADGVEAIGDGWHQVAA